MAKHIYLAKASNALVSHCRCENALITYPGQLDCPWCGCGWLFSCQLCRKAFTFAKGIETEESWEDLARQDLRARFGREPDDLDIQRWVNAMRSLLADVEPGETYVTFDGSFVAASMSPLSMEGWFARHELEFVPQTAALEDPSVLDDVLTNKEYWLSKRLPDESAN